MKKKIAVAIAVLVVLAVGAFLIIRHQADKAARRQVDSVAVRIPDVEAIDYDRVRVDWQASRVHIEKVTVSLKNPQEKIHIDEILVHDGDLTHEVPDRLDVEIRGVHLGSNQPRLESLRPILEEAGYEEVALNIRCTYRYDRSSRRLAIDTLQVAADDAGRLAFSAQFHSINLPRLIKSLSDKAYLITTIPGISVAGAELLYVDDTLAHRLLAAWARRTSRTPKEVGLELTARLDRDLGQTDRPVAREALSELKSFVSDPQTLRVTAAPPAPVSFFRFLWARQPSDFLELLHVKVAHK